MTYPKKVSVMADTQCLLSSSETNQANQNRKAIMLRLATKYCKYSKSPLICNLCISIEWVIVIIKLNSGTIESTIIPYLTGIHPQQLKLLSLTIKYSKL